MSNRYILSLDQGTTSSRTLIIDQKGQIVSIAQKEFKQHYPQPGWVEHDANEIWSTQSGTIAEALAKAKLTPDQIAAIGITNQRETTVVWDRRTGHPIHPAIVWQDRRTAHYCDQLKSDGHGKSIQEKTGLLIDAYFSATKLKWILDQVPDARASAASGHLAFGTIDSWLIWNLTNGKVHATDVSNASRTMLYNIHELRWDTELLQLFDIPASLLPEVRSSSEIYGHASLNGNKDASGIPIAGLAGDQQAALFGQLCTKPGMAKNTYGTGCFMLMNTGEKAISSNNRLLTTIAWQINGKTQYALEGSVFIAGAVVQWLRDELKIIRHSHEVEALAAQVPNADGVYLVPAFAGLGAPHWNPHARGSIFGLTRGSNQAHIARAALDSIAYQTADVLHAMNADAGIPVTELRVDGGATINNSLMQFQSDLLKCSVVRPKITETTALGAAYLAGLAVGVWDNIDSLQSQWEIDRKFVPTCTEEERSNAIDGWHRAVKASIAWSEIK
ncbi:MAG: glycerol kinase GlpK [Bacteroidota bacterium]